MDLSELQVFLMVASERSFSRAAAKLHRTQPAVSQSVKRLEEELGERLFDRSSKGGQLTEAGSILIDYARQLVRLKEEAEGAVRELQDLRRGRVLVGANEAAVHILLPVIERFRQDHPQAQVEVTRTPARQIAGEVLNRSLDFGAVTFAPRNGGLASVALGEDDLVMLTRPDHPLASHRQVTMEQFGQQTVIAHNDPSPARERVLHLYEQGHAEINIQIELPSLDGIKRAIEIGARGGPPPAPVRPRRNRPRPTGSAQHPAGPAPAGCSAHLPGLRRDDPCRRSISRCRPASRRPLTRPLDS